MSTFSEQLHQATKDIHLSAVEQNVLRERLVSYMEHRPLRNTEQAVFSRSFNLFSFSYARYVTPAVLIVVVFVSGGVSYAAEGAFPGDVLYPVKVKVNEEVKSALILNDEDKLSWNIRRAERRLEEASALAAKGVLDTNAQEQLTAQFALHASDVETGVSAVTESNPALALEMNSQFEASLVAHGEVIQQVSGEDARKETEKFLEHVEARRRGLSDTLAFADTPVATSVASESMTIMSLETGVVPEAADRSSAKEVAPAGENAPGVMAFKAPAVDGAGEALLEQGDAMPSANQLREASVRMDKLVETKFAGIQSLLARHEGTLTNDQRAVIDTFIVHLKEQKKSAGAYFEGGDYREAFRTLRGVLLTALRLEVYLRAAGELGLSNAAMPVLPPDFESPRGERDRVDEWVPNEEADSSSAGESEDSTSSEADSSVDFGLELNVDLLE